MPRDHSIKSVLVIGSGPIVIGQAAEFDYAGAQACRVLKAEGIRTVLVNSNPATIMTDRMLADAIYLEPLTVETVKRIIRKEKPDSLLATLGGQTGLTLAMQLSREGFLRENGVRLLGTGAEAIERAEDRERFCETMRRMGQPLIPSDIAETVPQCLAIAERIGYPVIVRPSFTLGGAGGGAAFDAQELERIAAEGLQLSPVGSVLIERYIYGWKEIEFEVMRDRVGSVVSVCSMENFDPVGVHTGDSIVVAPTLTLADREFQMLRSAALDIITELKIEGGCNVQFALNPESFEYAVIEVNPRVSRSSALASKATGYPIAKVSTRIALGYTLDEIRNDVTGRTFASFEPTVDYVVVKLPKWPFEKLHSASRKLGTQMKATGEVMAIAHSFEAALMKAVRGAELPTDTLNRTVNGGLEQCDDLRLFRVFAALKKGVSVAEIHAVTKIDEWFLNRLKRLAEFEAAVAGGLDADSYRLGKRLGYTDAALSRLGGKLPEKQYPKYNMVDTCGGEFEAQTPYFYADYDIETCEAAPRVTQGRRRIVVLGSGPIRIGQGIEFDYSSVHCVRALQKLGCEVVIINNNPETVSTDFDTADRLYFEPLCPEDVENILRIEQPEGVVVAFGGQTAIKLTKFLDQKGIKILGTSAEGIDLAEDRQRFDALLETYGFRRPKGLSALDLDGALAAARQLEYPVLLRPSYVIGGQNMIIARSDDEVERYMNRILAQGIENPVLIDRYLPGSELEVDVISDGKDVLIPGIMQHIERAGVHSGDSIAVYPPYNVNDIMLQKIVDCSRKLTLSLGTRGLVNIQYLIYENELYVIEVNPRASRTVPYISKVTGVPMVDLATAVMLGQPLAELGYDTGLYRQPPYVAVKVPVFSFEKLADANSSLGPEMKSTGEVLGIGKNLLEALYKGMRAAGYKLYHRGGGSGGVFLSVGHDDKFEVVKLAKKLDDLGLRLYATEGTAREIEGLGIDVTHVAKLSEPDADGSSLALIRDGKLDYVVVTGTETDEEADDYIALHAAAMHRAIPCISSMDTANALADVIAGGYNESNTELVDLCNMRRERSLLRFARMHGNGDDYLFFENFDGRINCPESLCITLCDRHTGIGGDGLVLIEGSEIADARMRIFNRDGSEGKMAGNAVRCVGKYLYDNGIVKKERMTVETASGVKTLTLYLYDGRVRSVSVEMGKPEFLPEKIPTLLGEDTPRILGREVRLAGDNYRVTCLSMGNPHCVIFCDKVDAVDLEKVGPAIENDPAFPQRVNVEFVRAVNGSTLKMRTWERGNGETPACGTGACAAAVAAVELGLCPPDSDITVKVRGGDLTVHYSADTVTLTGNAALICEGIVEF